MQVWNDHQARLAPGTVPVTPNDGSCSHDPCNLKSVERRCTSIDFHVSTAYGLIIRQADQTNKKMRQPNLPEEAPSGIQAARHFPL
jgi:hypothetical protein